VSETPSTPLAVSLAVLNPEKQGVGIEFHWTGERFSHQIFGLSDGQVEPLLASIEGSPEDSFPASPPFVELYQQEEIIFLTGATDAGHWSMSIESIRDGKLTGFLFDAACRIKLLPDGLTSCYRKAESVRARLGDSSLLLSTGLGDFCLQQLPLPATHEQPSCLLAFAGSEVRLTQKILSAGALPTTVRWQYRLIA